MRAGDGHGFKVSRGGRVVRWRGVATGSVPQRVVAGPTVAGNRWNRARAPSRAAADCSVAAASASNCEKRSLTASAPALALEMPASTSRASPTIPVRNPAQFGFVIRNGASQHQFRAVRLRLPIAHQQLQPRRGGGAGGGRRVAAAARKTAADFTSSSRRRTSVVCLRPVAGNGRRLYAFVIFDTGRPSGASEDCRR